MYCEKWKIVSWMFHSLCLVVTVCIIVFWIYMFALDEDISLVEYKQYYRDEVDIFPSLSLCFKNPFSPKRHVKENEAYNDTSYLRFANGEYFSRELIEID